VSSAGEALNQLAERLGVQLAYTGYDGVRMIAQPDVVLAACRSLGADITHPEDAAAELRRLDAEEAAVVAKQTIVADQSTIDAAPGSEVDGAALAATLLVGASEIPLKSLGDGRFRLPESTPPAVYKMQFKLGAKAVESTLLVPPSRTPPPPERASGVMLPLYAHRPDPSRSLGVATYSDLAALARWAGRAGADLLATLPLLAVQLDPPNDDPSPYAPLSRRRFSELFIDPFATPEAKHVQLDRAAAAELAQMDLLDYARAWSLVRAQLERLAEAAFANERRRAELIAAAQNDPDLAAYAIFRARRRRGEEPGSPLAAERAWQEDPDARLYLYAQVEADRQLASAQREAESAGCGLYLDMPVGVSAGGFDTWASPEDYAEGFTVGAPPDALFAGGQNWGFKPPHPRAGRRDGEAEFRADLAAHFRHASALRIDHVMMLHRLYWIPEGAAATDGIYIRYPHRDLYAALAIEAHHARGGAGAAVIGENLGTVPAEVNDAIKRWGLLGMDVAQFTFRDDRRDAIPHPSEHELACLGTHDTPLFRAFWRGADLDDNERLGVMSPEEADEDRPGRERVRAAVRATLGLSEGVDPDEDWRAALLGVLERLSASDAGALLVTLEDLWGETRPQNVPGVLPDRYPSWRRRVAPEHADFMSDPAVAAVLEPLLRRRASTRKEAQA
jgi:4-alpha-glucanotransferase